MEKVLRALGKVLIITLYVLVVLVIVGLCRCIWKAITGQYS